jgi:hypothetical protein
VECVLLGGGSDLLAEGLTVLGSDALLASKTDMCMDGT